MIGYICKYAPIEIIEAFGTPTQLIEPDTAHVTLADELMHANMCSFIKAVLEEMETAGYEGLLFTNCCDSARRLYDVLCRRYPEKFFFCLDLPHKITDFAASLYEKQIQKLINAYAAFQAQKAERGLLPENETTDFDPSRFLEICKEHNGTNDDQNDHSNSSDSRAHANGDMEPLPVSIGLAGARPNSQIRDLIRERGANIAFDLTCTAQKRTFSVSPDDRMHSYAWELLNQIPCLRMAKGTNRETFLKNMAEQTDGIIYHTVQFCDIYGYEYADLKFQKEVPVLKIETDASSQCSGQILTRLDAFLETLYEKKGLQKAAPLSANTANSSRDDHGKEGDDQPMYVLGIDSGSTSTNAVLMNDQKELVAYRVLRTGAKSTESAQRILEQILEDANLSRADIRTIVSTGYGRVSIPFADHDVTEISCHGKGAHYLNPDVRTILDIGGQDSKAIRLNEHGDVIDFVMNDKCAAGTGRFLEMMARTLEIGVDELGPISAQSKKEVTISSMCSVFAESEVISLIAQDTETADIVNGIHHAIIERAWSLIRRVSPEPVYMMTGGVAKNAGVVRALEEKTGSPVFISQEPEIVGAIGAALYGLELTH